MDSKTLLEYLKHYESELKNILTRYQRSLDSISINPKDDPIYRQKIVEILDLLKDAINDKSYFVNISNQYNDGLSNFLGSPSYKSIETIIGIISALITRVERNPDILNNSQYDLSSKKTASTKLHVPEKVTLPWLFRNLSVSLIWQGIVIIGFIFMIGFYLGQNRKVLSILNFLPGVNIRTELTPEIINELKFQVIEGHNKRLEMLQKSLLEQEDKAANSSFGFAEQIDHAKIADSIKTHIKEEKIDFEEKMKSLIPK